jgi:alkaline phosphatase D
MLILVQALHAQPRDPFVSGPMLGQVELRTAAVWAELTPAATRMQVRYWKEGTDRAKASVIPYRGQLGGTFVPVTVQLGGLEMNSTYLYEIEAWNGERSTIRTGTFMTKDLWQWRKPPPDFSFLTGSCAYFNEPQYDRPGKPYGGDSSIFLSMAKEKAAFMLWLGDNWYTREADYNSNWGLWYRASHDRAQPVLAPLLKAMAQYAIWDDHDYGPNDFGKEYTLKEESRRIFQQYWPNPSYGEEGQGIYTKISYGDADIFLLDDRYFRSSDRMADSVGGKPDPSKKMFGDRQMDWLKSALAGSTATFKIIATGSQVLNPLSPFDCFRRYPVEYGELMSTLRDQHISGVIFLTGDRHHSEVIRRDDLLAYPLYDVTASPLTSGTHTFAGPEKTNPYRVLGIDQKQNYTRVTISGKPGSRTATFIFLGVQGEELGRWQVGEAELKAR